MKKITRQNLRPFLQKYTTDVKVLDVGAGRIETNHSYEDIFPNRHCVDIDPDRKPDTVADAHALPFDENSYDFVLCTEILEHLHTPQKAIDEMQRVLRPGGTLILTTRFVYPIHDAPHDYYRFTKYGLEHLFRNWEVVELIPETTDFVTVGALMQRIGFQSKLRANKLTKIFVYCAAFCFSKINFLRVQMFGDIGKKTLEDHILASGYYMACKNIK